MDGLASPAALAALGLAIPILLTYMLRTRRPRQVVPSTFLWGEATKNVAATRPFQRLRPSILLFLQLALLAALVLALARPYRSTLGVGGSHLVLVVDASGSMLATDEVPSRIEAARSQGEQLVESLSDGALVSIISAQARPRVLVSATPSRSTARAALDNLEATEGSADFAEAFLLAESLETPARPATIVVVTDGGLTAEEARLVPPGAVIRSVGRVAENVAVSRLDTSDGPGGFRATAQIRNFGPEPQTTELVMELDGVPVASALVAVPAASSVERSFDLGAEGGRLIARIESADRLAADDRAYAVLERSRPRRILLVTPGNVFLESLVRQVPGSEVTVTPAAGDLAAFDLAIFDRVDPPADLKLPALFVALPGGPPTGRVTGTLENPGLSYLAADDPLLAQVDLADLAIAKAQRVEIPGSRTLAGGRSPAGETPLVAVWTQGTLKRAYLGFDLHESNLPLQVAFPILGDHLLSWLGGSGDVGSGYAGRPIEPAAPPSTGEVRIKIPGGREASILPGQVFDETERAGFYGLTFLAGDRVIAERTVALSFPPRESDIVPKGIEAPGGSGRPGLVTDARSSLARWVLLAALALMLVEWWWAHGRPLPHRPSLRARRGRPA
jgi:Ca-activated chloride channel homolog